MKHALLLGFGLLLPLEAHTQDVAPPQSTGTAPDTISYIEGGKWTYPSLTQIFVANGNIAAHVTVDCAIGPSGVMESCTFNALDPDDKHDADNAVGSAYLRYARVDPASVEGGIQPGDHVLFHYNWADMPHSDLSDAATLPQQDLGLKHNWLYPASALLSDSYPSMALNQHQSGGVVIYCTARQDGTIKECRTLVEVPPDYGFGTATVRGFEKYARAEPGSPDDVIKDGDGRFFIYYWVLP